MNKLTATVAGIAIAAAASIAPVFAQGAFSYSGTAPFVFSFTPANSFTLTNVPVNYIPFDNAVPTGMGFLTLSGGTILSPGSPLYQNVNLTFTNGTSTFTDVVPFTTVVNTPVGYAISSVGATAAHNQYNLVPGAPVPEASTVLSFGALLALGGFAVLRRKSAVQNAA